MAKPLKVTFSNITKSYEVMMNKVAVNAIVSVKDRLSRKGTDANDRKLVGGGGKGKYSDSYARFRSKKGRGISFINLQFTGKMLANLKPIRQKKKGRQVVIGFSSAEEQKKADETTERHGVWLGLTKKEQGIATKFITNSLKRTIKISNNTLRIK